MITVFGVIILILFFAVGGWGRGFGNNNGGDNGTNGYNACCTPATAQGVTDAFNFNQLDNGIRGLEHGMCDGFYTTASNISGVSAALQNCCCQTQQNIAGATATLQQSIADLGYNVGQGFCGVDKSILQANYQNQAGFNSLANQLASCCCDLSRSQENTKYAVSQAANEIMVAADKNTDRIINYLTQSELQNLRTQVDEYRSQLSQATQTQNIINQLLPVAKPAYMVQSPYTSFFGCGNGTTCC